MSKRRTAAKQADQPAERPVKLQITLSVELARRLGVHAEMTGQSKSELVGELVKAHCKRFVVSDRGKESADQGEVDAA